MIETIGQDADGLLDWTDLTQAIEDGHKHPKAQIKDTFLYRGKDTLLSRAAWVDGVGMAVKSATVFPGNAELDLPTVNGAVSLFADFDGALEAILDFHLVTKWKTAADSLLAATKLARMDAQVILILGAGSVATSLREAYGAVFPQARFEIWNRSAQRAQEMAEDDPRMEVAPDLEDAVRRADIITSATTSSKPLIKGKWLRPGQHIDLIGAFRPDMREADDEALKRARIFVDSRETTIDHIGELKIPIAAGVITPADVLGDFYDLDKPVFGRTSDDDITLFKNGGGAHLDLMTARYILDVWREHQ